MLYNHEKNSKNNLNFKELKTVQDVFAVSPQRVARSSFDQFEIEGKVEHFRAVFYLKRKFWIVIDHIETDRSRKINPLWHFHPDCTVEIQGSEVVTIDKEEGNLRLIPVGDIKWDINIIQGQTEPTIQGWYSEKYNKYVPGSCMVYSAEIKKDSTFGWILKPGQGRVSSLQVKIISTDSNSVVLKIKENNEKYIFRVPFKKGKNPELYNK